MSSRPCCTATHQLGDGHLLTTTDLTSVTPLPAAQIIHHALDDVHYWLRYPTVNLYLHAIISVPAVELGFTFDTAVTALPQRLFCGLSLFPHQIRRSLQLLLSASLRPDPPRLAEVLYCGLAAKHLFSQDLFCGVGTEAWTRIVAACISNSRGPRGFALLLIHHLSPLCDLVSHLRAFPFPLGSINLDS